MCQHGHTHTHTHTLTSTIFPTFGGRDLGLNFNVSGRKNVGFIFPYSFQLIRVNFQVVLKQFKLDIQVLFFREVYVSREISVCLT